MHLKDTFMHRGTGWHLQETVYILAASEIKIDNFAKFSEFVFFLAVPRLFTPDIAAFYEGYYEGKGVSIIKGTTVTAFEKNDQGYVSSCIHIAMHDHLVSSDVSTL